MIAKGQSNTLENIGKNLLGQVYQSNVYKKNGKQNITVKDAITKSLDSIRCHIVICTTKKLAVTDSPSACVNIAKTFTVSSLKNFIFILYIYNLFSVFYKDA